MRRIYTIPLRLRAMFREPTRTATWTRNCDFTWIIRSPTASLAACLPKRPGGAPYWPWTESSRSVRNAATPGA